MPETVCGELRAARAKFAHSHALDLWAFCTVAANGRRLLCGAHRATPKSASQVTEWAPQTDGRATVCRRSSPEARPISHVSRWCQMDAKEARMGHKSALGRGTLAPRGGRRGAANGPSAGESGPWPISHPIYQKISKWHRKSHTTSTARSATSGQIMITIIRLSVHHY